MSVRWAVFTFRRRALGNSGNRLRLHRFFVMTISSTRRAQGADVHDLSSLLDVIDTQAGGGDLTLNDLLKAVGRRAYGPLLLLVGLVSISPAALIPGSTWAFAILTLVISAQLMLHKDRLWMPQRALRMKISGDKLCGFIRMSRPVARIVDKVLRPRLTALAEPPLVIVIALLCAIAGLITFPLGLIPLAPFVPGIAIAFFGLGLTARDGLVLLLGAAVMSGALWLLASRAGDLF